MSNQEKKICNGNRETYIDVSRGIVIVLMLVGHSSPPAMVVRGIFGFHMPFFFILSGLLYDSEKWKRLGIGELIAKRWRTYLVPYFVLSFINLIINLPVEIYKGIVGKELLKSTADHIFWIAYSWGSAAKTPNCTPLWFLPCMFVCSIFVFLLLKINSRMLRITVCVIASALDYVLYKMEVPQLPWHIEVAMLGAVFMYIGICLKKSEILERFSHIQSCLIIIGLMIVGLCSIFINPRIDLNHNLINNMFLMYIGAVSVSISIIIFTKMYFPQNRLLEFYGKNTLLFMGFNNAINTYSKAIWEMTPGLKNISFTWWICVVIDLLVLTIIGIVWNRMKPLMKRETAIGEQIR